MVLPLSWWRSQRPGRASPLPRVRPWSLVSPCFWADPSLSPPSTAFFRLPLRLARLAHSPRSRRRHSSNSHSVRAAARGLARSGVYEIAFAVLAATVVPNDLVETSRLSGTRRAQPKKLRECDPAHTVSRSRTAYLRRAASRLRVGGVRAVEGAMLKAILRDKNASRVEIDQRARDARLQLKHIERLLVSRAAVTAS